ncbi:hypothetical protein [Pedobacter hartonius]|uniref:Uncharacterized protein n=1 Tax=Pedobacter hartonius TaxID=425514 RepID=A0A1H4FTI3_9SPHI|nr:hypothetical protein [Pedobacter hartonius]SEA99832.1 hypothetical protein SAMN05443550_10882 [Pedobacter hartonius]
MINRVLILSPIPLTRKIYDNFYIDQLILAGIKVEFIDFSDMFSIGDLHKHELNYAGTIKVSGKKAFNNILKRYSAESDCLIFSTFSYCYQFLFIYRILKKYKFPVAFMARGAMPSFQLLQTNINRNLILISKLINPIKCIRICQTIITLIFKKIGLTKKIEVIFQAGIYGLRAIGTGYQMDVKSADKIIGINYFDYDQYIQIQLNRKNTMPADKYVVFLDEYLPYHPDFDLLSMKKVNAETYYKELNLFFDYVERSLNTKVIIAAHPKSVYDVNPFEGRLISINQTAEVVSNSRLVLAHSSTSISFAVCFNKKVLLLSSKEIRSINGGYLHNSLLGFSEALELEWVDITTSPNIDLKKIEINRQKYESYLYSYLTNPDSEKRQTQEIFLEYLISK